MKDYQEPRTQMETWREGRTVAVFLHSGITDSFYLYSRGQFWDTGYTEQRLKDEGWEKIG